MFHHIVSPTWKMEIIIIPLFLKTFPYCRIHLILASITFHMIPIYCHQIDVSATGLPARSLISSSHSGADSPVASSEWLPSPQSNAFVV